MFVHLKQIQQQDFGFHIHRNFAVLFDKLRVYMKYKKIQALP